MHADYQTCRLFVDFCVALVKNFWLYGTLARIVLSRMSVCVGVGLRKVVLTRRRSRGECDARVVRRPVEWTTRRLFEFCGAL